MKKFLSMFLILVVMFSLLPDRNVQALAENIDPDQIGVNRFNVMLVVDASESLVKGEKTDPKGLRYDALRLFSGLLTENGNYVGAIVFNDKVRLNTGMVEVNNMATKLSLMNEIEKISATGYTNLGDAMLKAVEELEGKTEENGLPSIILLLSDGNTSMDTYYEETESREKGKEAIEKAVNSGVTIHSVWLNVGGKGDLSEILSYTNPTGGICEEVASADDLQDAFQRFFSIINKIEYNDSKKIAFDENGCTEVIFNVPRFGIEEVNIVFDINSPLKNVSLTKPNGDKLSASSISGSSIVTTKYHLIKLPKPDAGRWKVELEGEKNGYIDINMIYNYTIGAILDSNSKYPDKKYIAGIPFQFECSVIDKLSSDLTEEDFQTMDGMLNVVEAKSEKTTVVPMTVWEKGYYAEYVFDPGDYYIYATLGFDDFSIKTNTLEITVGKNY